MMAAYDGFKGDQTVSHILSTIPNDLLASVTGKQAGQIMSIRNAAYHEGKHTGIEICDDCAWIPAPTEDDPKAGQLVPLEILRKIKIVESKETRDGVTWGMRTYTLPPNATESW